MKELKLLDMKLHNIISTIGAIRGLLPFLDSTNQESAKKLYDIAIKELTENKDNFIKIRSGIGEPIGDLLKILSLLPSSIEEDAMTLKLFISMEDEIVAYFTPKGNAYRGVYFGVSVGRDITSAATQLYSALLKDGFINSKGVTK